MPMLQKCFLHTPADSAGVIQDYINRKHPEGDQLDFKAPPGWTDGFEAAKDMAAFANHLGGDIIIGVDDVDDCASNWNPIPDSEIAGSVGKISNWLTDIIRPREFAAGVDITPVRAPGTNHSVIVVSVPPSAELVGVERGSNFRFPIRNGRKTRWLIFEEVMSRASTSSRGTYIKLKALADSIGSFTTISFTSPVLVVAGGELKDLLKPGRIHCEIVELTPDVIKVKMNGSENPIRGRKRNPGMGLPSYSDSVTVEAGHKLTIPLELVRAVWKDQKSSSQREHMSIALAANIVWNGEYWSVVTGAVSY